MSGRVAEFANLSNGVLCAPSFAPAMRLQSTWCEQKRWPDVLWTVPADLYRAAGAGRSVVVHDQSERLRLTRAQWQGLSMIRHVLRRAWRLPVEPEFARGHNVTAYWDRVYRDLDDRLIRFIRYFGTPDAAAQVRPCDCPRQAARLSA